MSQSLNKIKGVFWTEDPLVLIRNNSYLNFVPKYESTREEQLNSIVRFCLYFIIINVVLQNEEKWLYLPIIMIVITSLFFYIDKYDNNKNTKRVKKILNNRKKDIIKAKVTKLKEDKVSNNFIEEDKDIEDDDTTIGEEENNQEIEAGFYDSNGTMLVGKKYSRPTYDPNPIDETIYTGDELIEYQQNTCKRPTRDNPFMNPNITDYNKGDSPAACNADDEEVQKEIELNFNKDLYRNIEDLWDKKNSQRQFYTLPSTSVPNNQVDFAKWLYLHPKTCKENQEACLKYEDLRFKR